MKITIEIETLKTVDKRKFKNIIGALVTDILNSVDSGKKSSCVIAEIFSICAIVVSLPTIISHLR